MKEICSSVTLKEATCLESRKAFKQLVDLRFLRHSCMKFWSISDEY